MLRNPVRMKADDSVFDAIDQIVALKVSGVCVVGDDDELLGVLSEIDCMRVIMGSIKQESKVGTVGEYMTKDVISVKMHDNIVDVAQDMLQHKHRRRPVISDDGKLMGQVSCRQLLRAVTGFSSPEDPAEN